MSRLYTADGKRRSSMEHAKHASYCICGKVLHGNGAASHFYINGQRELGRRDGHRPMNRAEREAAYAEALAAFKLRPALSCQREQVEP